MRQISLTQIYGDDYKYILLQRLVVGPIMTSTLLLLCVVVGLTIIYYNVPCVMIAVDILLTTSQFYCAHEEKGHALMKERVARSLACHPP